MLKSVLLESENGSIERWGIEACERRASDIYLNFTGIESRDAAEKLRGCYLLVSREEAIQLPEGHEFICDLIACEVVTKSGQKLGNLKEVLQYGAADVYVIEGERRLMVPALKKLFLEVDVANKRMLVDDAVLAEVALWDED